MSSLSEKQLEALEKLVNDIRKGGKGAGEYVSLGGGKTTHTLTFIRQLLDDAQGSIIPEKPMSKASQKLKKLVEAAALQKGSSSKWTNEKIGKFQELAQKYISGLPPQYQLIELNRLQQKCPFVLLDPKRKKLTPEKMKYGYADLYRFLGFPYGTGIVRSKMQGQNPFYAPIKFPIPDIYANNVLAHIRRFSPSQKLMEAKEIYKELMSTSGGAGGYPLGMMVNPKTLDSSYRERVNKIIELVHDINTRTHSPVELSHLVKGQERPMRSYLKNNFNTMLGQLNRVHLIKPIHNAPETTGYTVDGTAMNTVVKRKASTKSKSKRKSKRKSGRKSGRKSTRSKSKRK